MPHFVYLAQCSDNSLYTGTCIDVKAREAKHNDGTGAKYTRSRRPIKIVYFEDCSDLSAARSREAAIKKLSRKEKLKLLHSSSRDSASRFQRKKRKNSLR